MELVVRGHYGPVGSVLSEVSDVRSSRRKDNALVAVDKEDHSVAFWRTLVPKVEDAQNHPLSYLGLKVRFPVPIIRLRDPVELGEAAFDPNPRIQPVDAVHSAAKPRDRVSWRRRQPAVEGERTGCA